MPSLRDFTRAGDDFAFFDDASERFFGMDPMTSFLR
jgi:hypothetical protein